MKKLLLSALMAGSIAIVAPAVEAKTTSVSAVGDPQIKVQIGGRRNQRPRYNNNRRQRTVTTTRIVGYGRNRYRETIQTTYFPNGRTVTRVISRERFYGYPR